MARPQHDGREGGVRASAEGSRGRVQPDHQEDVRIGGRRAWRHARWHAWRRARWWRPRRRRSGRPHNRGGRLNERLSTCDHFSSNYGFYLLFSPHPVPPLPMRIPHFLTPNFANTFYCAFAILNYFDTRNLMLSFYFSTIQFYF